MSLILVVEDDRLFRKIFKDILVSEGYQIDCAACGRDALHALASKSYDLVVTDLVMPDINGLEILAHVRENYPAIDVIMVTGNANLESAIYALKHGARDYLVKPVNRDEFKHSVAQCLQQRRLLDENEDLKRMLTLYQASQAIASCLDTNRVFQLLLDSILRETGVSRAIALFTVDSKLELTEARNLPAELTRVLSDQIISIKQDLSPEKNIIQRYSLSNGTPDEIKESYLIHVQSHNVYRGVIALFNESGSGLADISPFSKNIVFLIEQSAHAFENAESFSNAKEMLFIDDISGLFNHRYLDIALDREMKRVERYASHLAVLFIDVDGFKSVNDTYGHLVGSRVLAEFGALLKKSVRDVDVVIRYGGDEYTAILVETPSELAQTVAERIRKQVEQHHFHSDSGPVIRLTCSIGYACCPEDAANKDELLEMADKAMYVGKATGKNCIQRIKINS